MKIGSYELESPLINGGGVIKTAEEAELMARTGVGALLGGSYTLEPRVGNSPNGETVFYHDASSGLTANSLGMPNKGIREVARYLPNMIQVAHRYNKAFILNIAPVSGDPVGEVEEIFDTLEKAEVEGLDACELNAGCPNVVTEDGGRHELLSHHPDQMGLVLAKMGDIASRYAIGDIIVRISPFHDQEDAQTLASSLIQSPVKAVVAFNTFPGNIPRDEDNLPRLEIPGDVCGLSGSQMANSAEEQTAWLVKAREMVGADFDIIGSNGILDAASIKRRLDLGVAAVSLTTLFYITEETWPTAVDKLLHEYAATS